MSPVTTPVPRTLRRSLALSTLGAVLLVPSLSGCGFNMATDRVYTPAAGVNYRDGSVDILNAAIVSKAPNSGTFVASFVNDGTSKATFTDMSGDGSAIANVDAKPIGIEPNTLVNLADQGGIHVSGTFTAGDFVNVTLDFDNGESETMDVPVVSDGGQWAGLDTSTGAPSPSSSPSSSPTS